MPTTTESELPTSLCYSCDEDPGYVRKRRNEDILYLQPDGKPLNDEAVLQRIESMAIPPAWKDVWICQLDNGHLQVTGRDGKNRKQYIYHQAYVDYRQRAKFDRIIEFAEQLPVLRKQVVDDLKGNEWTKQRMLAMLIRLLDRTHLRIGNARYEQENGTYGLTTLRRKHLNEDGKRLQLCFNAKSGKFRTVTIKNRSLKRMVRELSELPGYQLFRYKDKDGIAKTLDSKNVNEYLRAVMGDDFSAKDFRTWAATSLCVLFYKDALNDLEASSKGTVESKLVRRIAKELGNTMAVCRTYYIHPQILELARKQELPEKQWSDSYSSTSLAAYEEYTLKLLREG